MKSNEIFFNNISGFYDGMIGFEEALERRKKLLGQFLIPEMKTAADFGCGSGLDSISLALNNLEVTAFDLSEGMLQQAAENARRTGTLISFKKRSVDNIEEEFFQKFDLVVSLGNTLALLEERKLSRAMRNIYSLLRENGKTVLQILNYNLVVDQGERIVNITNRGEETYVRFYDFLPRHINFNILRFKTNSPKDNSLYTTKLYPHTHTTLLILMRELGFRDIQLYGSLAMDLFKKDESKDLIIVASK